MKSGEKNDILGYLHLLKLKKEFEALILFFLVNVLILEANILILVNTLILVPCKTC